jgi:hypothetical protein
MHTNIRLVVCKTFVSFILRLSPDICMEWQLLEMAERKLALEQGALALSSAQVSFRT